MNCENCGKDISDMRSGTRFCSVSCRSSFHQKEKRQKEKKTVEKIRKKINLVIPRAAVWFFLILVAVGVVPLVVGSVFESYRKYEIGKQNEELQELRQEMATIKKPELEYHELKQKYAIAKSALDVLLEPKNGWIPKDHIKEFKKSNKDLLKELDFEF